MIIDNVVVYCCDPKRSLKCTKESCYNNGGTCSSTTDPNCAFVDSKGNPILDRALMTEARTMLEKRLGDLSKEMTKVHKRIREIDSIIGNPPEVEEWKSKLANIWGIDSK